MKLASGLCALLVISFSFCYGSFEPSISHERETNTAALEIIQYSINNFDRDFDKAISILQLYKMEVAKTPKALRTVDQVIGSVENYRDIENEVDSGFFDGISFNLTAVTPEQNILHGISMNATEFRGAAAVFSSLSSEHTYVGSEMRKMPEIDEQIMYQAWLYSSSTDDWFALKGLHKSPDSVGQFESNEMYDEKLTNYDKYFVALQRADDAGFPDAEELLLESTVDRNLITEHIVEIEDNFRK